MPALGFTRPKASREDAAVAAPPYAGGEVTRERRREQWRWILAALLLPCAWMAVGHWRGRLELDRFHKAAAARRAEIDARPTFRPVLWGQLRSDAAWPHYERALAATAGIDQGHLTRLCVAAGAQLSGKPLPASTGKGSAGPAAAELLAAHAPTLAWLHAGAHAADGRRPMLWHKSYSHGIIGSLAVRAVANLVVLRACTTALAGNGTSAVRDLLDAMQMGRDCFHSPQVIEQMIGCDMLHIAGLEALQKSDLHSRLAEGDLLDLAEGLARLDASLPVEGRFLESEAVLFASYDFTQGPGSVTDGLWLRAWRYGFSESLAIAQHGRALLELQDQLTTLGSEGVLDLTAARTHFAEFVDTANPVSAVLTPAFVSIYESRCRAIASVRLVRMAVQHVLGLGLLPLADPAGGMLQTKLRADGSAELWRAGNERHSKLVVSSRPR